MGLTDFAEKYRLQKKVGMVVAFGKGAYELVQSVLWPIYSAGVLVSIFHLLCLATEKQMIADHYFGNREEFEKEKEELLVESKKLFQEELATAIKEKVWMLPDSSVKHEYKSLNIS